MESQEFNAGNIQSAEVTAKEVETLKSIRDFTNQLFKEECQSFDGPIRYRKDAAQLIRDIFEERRKQTTSNLSQDNRLLKHGIEYEICKDVIDYKNVQLKRLTEYIEKQPIWKTKFSTSKNIGDNYPIGGFSQLISALEKSEEVDKKDNFAGKTEDSIYYVSRSGICLRLKRAYLLPSLYLDEVENKFHNINNVLVPSLDLSFYVNDVMFHKEIKKKSNSEEYPLESVSFQPKLGYRVEEFLTEDFLNHKEGNFKSKIEITKKDNKLIVENFDYSHSGHLINKIYFEKT